MKKYLALISASILFSCAENKSTPSENQSQDSTLFKDFKIGMNKARVDKMLPARIDTISDIPFNIQTVFTPEDSLAGIMLSGPERSATEIETRIQSDIESLNRAFSVKYGEPSIKNGKATILKSSESKDYVQYMWELPTKTVQIGLAANEGKFSSYMKIYNDRLIQKAFSAIESAKQEQANKDSKKF